MQFASKSFYLKKRWLSLISSLPEELLATEIMSKVENDETFEGTT